MRRFHLAEIEDQPWCPPAVRDGGTDYLQFVLARTQPYRCMVPRLAQAFERSGAQRIIDLCSGGGGPWPALQPQLSEALGRPVEVCLTDRYPNTAAWKGLYARSGGAIEYSRGAVDATRVPASLPGFRTLFSGFHHFRPPDAARILACAVAERQGIAVFEATDRSAPAAFGMLLVPLIIAAVTPAIRPFRWERLLLTYVLPAIPLMGLWDGVVSCLRTYTPEELEAMARPFEQYEWQVGKERGERLAPPVTYLIGVPR